MRLRPPGHPRRDGLRVFIAVLWVCSRLVFAVGGDARRFPLVTPGGVLSGTRRLVSVVP